MGGASIAGRVVNDVTGSGVGNAALTFLRGGSALSADTTGDGRFALEGLEPGVYELYPSVHRVMRRSKPISVAAELRFESPRTRECET